MYDDNPIKNEAHRLVDSFDPHAEPSETAIRTVDRCASVTVEHVDDEWSMVMRIKCENETQALDLVKTFDQFLKPVLAMFENMNGGIG